jgi:hypothetical protein
VAHRDAGAGRTETLATVGALLERIDLAIAKAGELTTSAKENDFDDMARNAEGLRQQLMAARNQLTLVHRKASGDAPS